MQWFVETSIADDWHFVPILIKLPGWGMGWGGWALGAEQLKCLNLYKNLLFVLGFCFAVVKYSDILLSGIHAVFKKKTMRTYFLNEGKTALWKNIALRNIDLWGCNVCFIVFRFGLILSVWIFFNYYLFLSILFFFSALCF